MRSISDRWSWILALLCVLALSSLCDTPRSYADGGAPNLSYVSGTPSGVSVIDVGQAKVTKTRYDKSVAGSPHMLRGDGSSSSATTPSRSSGIRCYLYYSKASRNWHSVTPD